MQIGVIGTGYVGLVTGACLSEIGNVVICQDSDQRKIDLLNKGEIPIYEPGLLELVKKNREEKRLFFNRDLDQVINSTEVIFICVGTPPLENGDADVSAVEQISREIALKTKDYKLIVSKSTVPVQTGEWIEKTIKIYKKQKEVTIDVASNPEFLREGSAIADFFHPDRIVIGAESKQAREHMKEIYLPIIKQSFNCPVHDQCQYKKEPYFFETDIKTAELIKHASNSFLAMKISFINAVANICEKTGANIKDLAFGMGLDKRIGKDFLDAGLGFGGFCFPKDLRAFIRIAEKSGYDFNLLKEVEKINLERPNLVMEKLKNLLWVIRDKQIALLGLAFKPNTDDIRYAPAIELIKLLLKEGAKIRAYDPVAMENMKKVFPSLDYCLNVNDTVKEADALILVTEWGEFKTIDLLEIKKLMRRPLIFDARNFYEKKHLLELGFEYVGMGV